MNTRFFLIFFPLHFWYFFFINVSSVWVSGNRIHERVTWNLEYMYNAPRSRNLNKIKKRKGIIHEKRIYFISENVRVWSPWGFGYAFYFFVFVFFPFRRIVHYNLITRRKKSESSESWVARVCGAKNEGSQNSELILLRGLYSCCARSQKRPGCSNKMGSPGLDLETFEKPVHG